MIFSTDWWSASLTRSIRTMAQTAIAVIGSAAVLSQVDWKVVLSSTILAGILCVLTALAGLPEVESNQKGDKVK